MAEVLEVLRRAKECFWGIPGVKALVLGGSHATGSAVESSDVDIGVYYDSRVGLDPDRMNRAAREFDDRHQDGLVTGIGGWGPWINGGGWLLSEGTPVDLLFRDFDKVSSVVGDCLKGKLTLDYQPGHPFAFVNSIYLGEVAYCKPFLEKDGDLRQLKNRLQPYPETYRKAVYEKFLWEAEFSLSCGQKGIKKGDVAYCAGSLFRAVNAIVQVLYAAQGEYLLNEKGSLGRLRNLMGEGHSGIADALDSMLCGLTPDNLEERFAAAHKLLEQVRREVSPP